MLILPHPINSKSVIHFENRLQEEYVFKLCNSSRKEILKIKTTDNQINIGDQRLPGGIYYYQLYSNSIISFRGKMTLRQI